MSKDFDISQEETSFSFKKNVVLSRLAYSHQSLYYAYVISWNDTFSWTTVKLLYNLMIYNEKRLT